MATWCAPCKKQLDLLHDSYSDWQENYGLNIIAISTDDARTAAKVPAMVAEKGWSYRIIVDSGKEFQFAANITSVPYSLLLDTNGNIVYDHLGFTPGDEAEFEKQIKLFANK